MFFKKIKHLIRRLSWQCDKLIDRPSAIRNRRLFRRHFNATQEWSRHRLLASPSQTDRRQILVIAPHIDDETLGCGGTIIKHIRAGDSVTVVFVTDGGGAHHDYLSAQEMITRRASEARELKKLVGLEAIYFLGLKDGNLNDEPAVIAPFTELLNALNFDLLYLPHFVDTHPDHRSVNKLVLQLLTLEQKNGCVVRAYESQCFMTATLSNIAVDISDAVRQKEAALRLFRSQGLNFNFAIERARSEALPFAPARYVETFWEGPLLEYEKLWCRFADQVAVDRLRATGKDRHMLEDYLNNQRVIGEAFEVSRL